MAALSAVSPRLAGRAAQRLFLTPPRFPAPRREVEALSRAEPFATAAGGSVLRGFRLGDGPAVLLVHGWGGRAGQLAAFAPPLAEAGCTVVGFDGPAHGASDGRIASMPHFADAIAAVAAEIGARAVIAHSMGAGATALAIRRGLELDAAVLIAPARSPLGFFEAHCAALGLGSNTRAVARRELERRVGVKIDDLDLVRAAPALSTPALLFHDRTDLEVPWTDGAAIARAWPGARLVTTHGLGHRRLLRDAAVVEEAGAFVLARLPRCACGKLARGYAGGEPRCAACLLDLHLRDRERRAEWDVAVDL